MSSDLYVPEMASCNGGFFFSDTFSPFFDPSMDILLELSESTSSLEDLSQTIVLSSSPPSQQLESFCLYQATQLQPNLGSITNSSNGCGLLDDLEVKLEECQVDYNDYMDIRHARSSTQWSLTNSSPLGMEEGNLKGGRYSAEERKERISKYRAKRKQRNFTKTIKYACRKTLADNRTRVRGRFARNDETGEIPKVACSAVDEHNDEPWFEGHEEHNGGGVHLLSDYGKNLQSHHYYGY